MIIYKCDMCGKEIREPFPIVTIAYEKKEHQVCDQCYWKLDRMLNEHKRRCGNCKYFCHGETGICGKKPKIAGKPIKADPYDRSCNEWSDINETYS